MSIAKRALLLTLGAILLVVAVCWGYWMYRQYRANQTPIPRDATSVVGIRVDGLIRDIAWNAWWDGASYRDSMGQPSTLFGRKPWRQLGIQVPAHLFLYQVDHARSGEFPGVYFGSVVVNDSTSLTTWLQDKLGMEIGTGKYGTIASSERALVIIQPKRALFALSLTKPKTPLIHLTDILANVLQQHGGSVAVSKSDFRKIIHSGGQVSGYGTHRFSIDFEKGLVAFSGRHRMGGTPHRLENTPHFADSNIASLWAQGDLSTLLLGRHFNLGGYDLDGDSLLAYYNGNIALEWKGTVAQQDTIVNLDYDDNFELVETREIVDQSVPEIYGSVLADTALTGYLQGQGFLEKPGNTINRDAFPLFQLQVSTLPSGYVQFHTAGMPVAPPSPSSRSGELLYLRIDFNKLRAFELPTDVVPYIHVADLLELSGKPTSAGEVVLDGTLHMKDPRQHSLVQLLASMKNE